MWLNTPYLQCKRQWERAIEIMPESWRLKHLWWLNERKMRNGDFCGPARCVAAKKLLRPFCMDRIYALRISWQKRTSIWKVLTATQAAPMGNKFRAHSIRLRHAP